MDDDEKPSGEKPSNAFMLASVQAWSDNAREAEAATAEWNRHVLTLSGGALALLAAIGPEAHSTVGQWLLAGTWVALGLGIIFGAAAAYGLAAVHSASARQCESTAKIISRTGEVPKGNVFFLPYPAWLRWVRRAMVASLLLAVVLLVWFSVDRVFALQIPAQSVENAALYMHTGTPAGF